MVSLAPGHRLPDRGHHSVVVGIRHMTEKYEPSYADLPPAPGLFPLEDLYGAQSDEFLDDHVYRLVLMLRQDDALIDYLYFRERGALPVEPKLRAAYLAWIQDMADQAPDAPEWMYERLRLETHDHRLRVLGHLAIIAGDEKLLDNL